jgi:hypothetical protein
MRFYRAMIPITVLMLALSLVGCGGPSGPKRFEVQGAVTYDGKPVPAGQITFEPDDSKGNKGPAAYALIHGGRYLIPRAKGSVAGAVVVQIKGCDGVRSAESPEGAMLFPLHEERLELPSRDTAKDFNIPHSAK